MNITSQDIGEFLSQNKTVSLEKIGTLDLNAKEQKDIFIYDKHAETSPELLQYLSEKKGKPLSIVTQDTEYYLDQSRQLMNIRAGNLSIANVGYIYANNSGQYAFSTDTSEAVREADKKSFEDMYSKSPLTSSVNYAAKKSRKPWRIIAAVVIILAAIIYGAYYVHTSPSAFSENKDSVKTAEHDTTENTPAATHISDSAANSAAAHLKGFKFIIQTFPDAISCQKRAQQLKNYGNDVFKDTATVDGKPLYRLYITDTSAMAADTMRMKDSLQAYYGNPVSVE